jgi:hypothetical protein
MGRAILVHFTPKGETVNSQNYCDVLRAKLKTRIYKNWRHAKLVKDATSNLSSEGLYKNLRNAESGALIL